MCVHKCGSVICCRTGLGNTGNCCKRWKCPGKGWCLCVLSIQEMINTHLPIEELSSQKGRK